MLCFLEKYSGNIYVDILWSKIEILSNWMEPNHYLKPCKLKFVCDKDLGYAFHLIYKISLFTFQNSPSISEIKITLRKFRHESQDFHTL